MFLLISRGWLLAWLAPLRFYSIPHNGWQTLPIVIHFENMPTKALQGPTIDLAPNPSLPTYKPTFASLRGIS